MGNKTLVLVICISLLLSGQLTIVEGEMNFEENKDDDIEKDDTKEDLDQKEYQDILRDEKPRTSENEEGKIYQPYESFDPESRMDKTGLSEERRRRKNDERLLPGLQLIEDNYEAQEPIRIDSDNDLAEKAKEENWSGNGSEDDPYIIEGYEIDGVGYGYSLYIGNVTDYFEVNQCYLHSARGRRGKYFKNSGLHLFNTSNGRIQDNIILNNSQEGIYLENTHNNTIFNNTVHSNEGHEILLERSKDNEVINNNIKGENYSSNLSESQENVEYSKESILVQLESPDDNEIKFWNKERALKFKTDEIANTVEGITSRTYPEFNMAEISLSEGADVISKVESLNSMEEVIKAEPNYMMDLQKVPNDPGYDSLWAMPTINAPNAWDITTGSEEVVVAVLDTGIDYNHPDLKDNMWTSEEGHHGYNAIDGSHDPMDGHGHGTHVAGTIGAVGDNELGVVGVNWNVSLMGVKIGTGSRLTTANAIAGLEYVLEKKREGENIVATSNSWGGGGYSELLYEAIEKHQKEGISFVAAAGNDGVDADKTPFYPANFDLTNIISVGATNQTDELAEFSNYGKRSVHVGAPGVDINSTFLDGEYAHASGTSMAAPHVSGLIALLRSHHPTYDHNQLKNAILSSSDKPDPLHNLTLTGGRVDAYQALQLSPDPEDIRFWVHRPTSETPWGEETPISISLNDGVDPVLGANVSVEFSTWEDTVYLEDDGSGGDQPGDGYYTGEWVPRTLGEVELSIAAELNDEREIMKNVTVTVSGDSGIALLGSNVNFLNLNNISDNYYGISLHNSQSNELKNNVIRNNQEEGVRFYESGNNELWNSTILFSKRGISFDGSDENSIFNSRVSDHYYGFFLDGSENNTILGNVVSNNENHGIWLDRSDNTSLIDNQVLNNYNGILLANSNNSRIATNTVSNNSGNGIWLDHSHRTEISSNIVSNNMFRAIDLHRSNHTSIMDNTISNSTIGMDIARSESAIITNNTLMNDSIYIWGSQLSWWDTHSIDTSNTVNGNPIYYWKNKTQATVPAGAGQIILVNCTYITVENQNLSDGSVGIQLGFSDNNILVNNTVSNNDKGIRLFNSDHNSIVDNTASNNSNSWFTLSYAIWISNSNSNKIVENTMLNNDGHSIYLSNSNNNFIGNNTGKNNQWRALQLLRSHGNTLLNNTASNSRYGISISSGSNENIVMKNTISDNSRFGIRILFQSNDNLVEENNISLNRNGIYLWESIENTIAKNKIIENEVQAWDNRDNNWDYGDPAEGGKGGNYWSDYDGQDRGDGIGKEPYEIEGHENKDSYPWMNEEMVRYEEDKSILDRILDRIDLPDLSWRPDVPDRREIPGFTLTMLLFAVIIAVSIYRKKE